MRKCVSIYTDGACIGNPGPGGWAALLIYDGQEKLISGSAPHSTNNRMEMQAAIEGLSALTQSCDVTLYSDSQLLIKGMTEWMAGWLKRGFRNSANKPVENRDLWEQLLELEQQHQVTWRWVKGHAGQPENERVDAAARAEAEKQAQS